MPIIAPSILTANLLRLEDEISMLNHSKADWIHLDIMDGVYVPNITFGFRIIEQIKSIAKKPLDVHLMITNADRYLEEFRDAGADRLTVHLEACPHLDRTINEIANLGMKPGVAINPHTSVKSLEYILPDLAHVLIMTVNPGFGAQKFIEYSYQKISDLKHMIIEKGCFTLIEIDGGVSKANMKSLLDAGVDAFVVGNTVFSAPDPVKMIDDLKELNDLN